MALAYSRMFIYEFLKRDLDIVPDEALLIILNIKSYLCMAKNVKYAKHTRHISRRVQWVINSEK